MQANTHTPIGPLDLSLPTLPPRSRLAHLAPVGMKEAYTEAVISYIYRLAEVHVVTARALLISEIIPLWNRCYLKATDTGSKTKIFGTFSPNIRTLNGTGDLSKGCVLTLERLTLFERLHCLTMLTWRNVLGEHHLLRHKRAWCPECYEDWKKGGDVIYEPLVWMLQMVEICAIHLKPLQTECPSCKKPISFLLSNTPLGHCSHCKGWLGSPLNYEKAQQSSQDELRYQLWVAENFGALIAAAPSISSPPSREIVVRAINLCVERITLGDIAAFARIFDTSATVVSTWKAGKGIPRVDTLFRICFHFCIPVLDFITRPDEVFDPKNEALSSWAGLKVQPSSSRIKRDRREQLLRAALEENPPPSPPEIAGRIGLKSFYDLKRSHPDLYEKVNSRYLSSEAAIAKRHVERRNRANVEVARERVIRALEEDPPPSAVELAKELGYSGGATLRRRVPELYPLLLKRRKEYFSSKKKGIRQALKKYLQGGTLISLKNVGLELNMSEATLKYNAADLCTAISKRYMKHRTLKSKILGILKRALKEDPPPPIKELVERSKNSRRTFYKYYPKLCYKISARYRQHRKKNALRKKAELQEAIRSAVSSLHGSGIFPGYDRVNKLLTVPINVTFRDFHVLYREVRREVTGD